MKRLAWFLLFALPAMAQVIPYRSPRVTFQDSVGNPLSGGCIFTYQGGTTTPQATYTDFTGGTPNANPVVLDVTGSAVMWLGVNTYKFKAYSAGGVNCSSGSLQWTVDQVPGDAFLNGTISGATITTPTISGGTDTGTALTGVTIVTSSIQSTPVGTTTPAAGSFTALSGALSVMAYSASPAFNAAAYNTFYMILTGNVSSSTISGGTSGQQITLNICQDGAGSHSFVLPASLIFPGGYSYSISQGIDSCTVIQAFNNSGNWIATFTSPPIGFVSNFPTVSSTSLGAGGTAALGTGSTDYAGKIVLTTGTGPVNPWAVTLTFAGAYPNGMFCEFMPINFYTVSPPTGISGFQGGQTGTTSVTVSGSAALPASTPSVLILAYLCQQ